jgi:lycopene elongase/hydratase (dihydrobisanhydrobacterioruberin-forming)
VVDIMDIKRIIKLSRPRFWLYLAGTFMVGFAFGITNVEEFLSMSFIIPFLLFLIPANIFIYGINDIADRDTDRLNPKKDDRKEIKTTDSEMMQLKIIVGASFIMMLNMAFFLNFYGMILLFTFLLLGAGYSIKPFRFKSKPFLDFLSNSFYMLPGIIGYYISSGMIAPLIVWVLGISWTGAMHLFSAIPDIIPDRKAKIKTTAVLLGHKNSLLFCIILWAFFVLSLIVLNINLLLLFLTFIYIMIPLLLMFMHEENVIKAYWYFPYLNAIIGMLFFFYAIIPKL